MKKRLHSSVAVIIIVIAVLVATIQAFEILRALAELRVSGVESEASVVLALVFRYQMDPVFLFCSGMMIEYLHRIWIALRDRNAPVGDAE